MNRPTVYHQIIYSAGWFTPLTQIMFATQKCYGEPWRPEVHFYCQVYQAFSHEHTVLHDMGPVKKWWCTKIQGLKINILVQAWTKSQRKGQQFILKQNYILKWFSLYVKVSHHVHTTFQNQIRCFICSITQVSFHKIYLSHISMWEKNNQTNKKTAIKHMLQVVKYIAKLFILWVRAYCKTYITLKISRVSCFTVSKMWCSKKK